MSPHATHDLQEELDTIDPDVRAKLARAGFDAARLLDLAKDLGQGTAAERRDKRNRVPGPVEPPSEDEIWAIPPLSSDGEGAAPSERHRELEALGLEALKKGELAFAVLAGGMATRMGGVVKALVEALPGHTFLDVRLRENRLWSARAGKPVPLWLMTSDATDEPTRQALAAHRADEGDAHVKTFLQDLGPRLTPDGHLFHGDDGRPSLYSPGHGDLVDALRRSGLLRDFLAAGGRYVWIANLDNLGATIDPVLLGLFIENHAAGQRVDVMCEVTDKDPGDRGGIPVHALGKLQVLEEFRLPRDFDASRVSVFNTNTFLVSAEALQTADIAWNWFEVEKNVDGKPAIQFERLLQELTGAMRAAYVRVPRRGAASRFLPVKDREELEARRNTILEVARSRGIL
ncbi:UTP--glucose-1-phosphate uridylyltransferase [Pendulispora rubella]|uniref:UTP--glucose-1-phosphate uridylyltransferase n=1 Tax=Pendulispora rubella TaxID=2741070 RepID=A0ABZ2L915_9BACT